MLKSTRQFRCQTSIGYAGGETANRSYEQVCSDRTGHAEAVEVEYEPAVVKYEKLLDLFWRTHDPTIMNRQAPDVGSQYRSAVFYHSDEQRAAVEESKRRLDESGQRPRPVVTQIVPAASSIVVKSITSSIWPSEARGATTSDDAILGWREKARAREAEIGYNAARRFAATAFRPAGVCKSFSDSVTASIVR